MEFAEENDHYFDEIHRKTEKSPTCIILQGEWPPWGCQNLLPKKKSLFKIFKINQENSHLYHYEFHILMLK